MSILFSTECGRKLVDPQLLNCLNIGSIFGDEILDILSYACSVRDAEERQTVFRELQNGKLTDAISAMYELIRTLKNTFLYYSKSKSRIEKLVTSYYICELYVNIYDLIVTCDSESVFLVELAEKVKKQNALIESIRNELAYGKAAVNKITVNYTYVECNAGTLTENEGTPLCDRITELAERIGVPIETKAIDFHRSVTDAEANAILHFRSNEANMLSGMCKYIEQLDLSILSLEGELDFYLKINAVVSEAWEAGIPVCFPDFTQDKQYKAADVYDITLLRKASIVANDVDFCDKNQQVFVVGVNGGGKTTYLRAAAVNLLLALNGCPVFCRSMEVFPFESICIHFPVSADKCFDQGNFFEESERLNRIISKSGSSSFCFLNETFSTTDDTKGTLMAIDTARKFRDKCAFMLYVTHFVNVMDSEFVTLVATGNSEGNNQYKITAGNSDGISFTKDILDKYGLSKSRLQERFGVVWN